MIWILKNKETHIEKGNKEYVFKLDGLGKQKLKNISVDKNEFDNKDVGDIIEC